MTLETINNLGIILHIFNALTFAYLFQQTMSIKDGVGLSLLRNITGMLAINSSLYAINRVAVDSGRITLIQGRAFLLLPIVLISLLAVFLNYVFHCSGWKK